MVRLSKTFDHSKISWSSPNCYARPSVSATLASATPADTPSRQDGQPPVLQLAHDNPVYHVPKVWYSKAAESEVGMHLYEVILPDGRNNPNWQKFYVNVTGLRGQPPDYGGIQATAIVSHHMDAETVALLCRDGFKGKNRTVEVQVTEITSETMKSRAHHVYTDLINSYFLPYNDFPNIK